MHAPEQHDLRPDIARRLEQERFISTVGAMRAASACIACARPISQPSGVAAELSDMFCALNGATR
jgi:hypothetical protein